MSENLRYEILAHLKGLIIQLLLATLFWLLLLIPLWKTFIIVFCVCWVQYLTWIWNDYK